MPVVGGDPLSGQKSRRADSFPVRRWLAAGAASAGVGAALLGFSLVGPQIGVAGAETGDESSVSSDPGGSLGNSSAEAEADNDETASADDTEDADDEADVDEEDADDNADVAEEDADDDADADADDALAADEDETAADEPDTDPGTDVDEDVASDPEPEVEALVTADVDDQAAVVDDEPETNTVAAEPVLAETSQQSPYQQWVAEVLDDWTAKNQAWVDSLSVSDAKKERLQASFLAMRRAFFNQAPTVAPVQIGGVITGPVVGTLGGFDPDGDRLVYLLTKAPKTGTVKINADGTYVYTPDDDFNGVDTFRVAAIDLGLHLNLLQLLRPLGSGPATSLVNQGAVKFDFRYNVGVEYWTSERQAALQNAANELVTYFRVLSPVVLSYDVTGLENAETATLAEAGGFFTSTDPGFWRTVLQDKLISGGDANGASADGVIRVNFGKPWALGDTVGSDEFDFTMAIMHELLHSFGFTFPPAYPSGTGRRYFSIFASLIVTEDRVNPFETNHEWDSDYNPNLVGLDGGLYFGGANAVAAYGGLVPLYTPNPWLGGSSVSHLDDVTFTGADRKIMNAATGKGPGIRVLSAVEIGILRDLGYRVVPQQLVSL